MSRFLLDNWQAVSILSTDKTALSRTSFNFWARAASITLIFAPSEPLPAGDGLMIYLYAFELVYLVYALAYLSLHTCLVLLRWREASPLWR